LIGSIHRSLRALVSTPERRLLLVALLVRLVPAALVFGTGDVSQSIAWGEAIHRGANPYDTIYKIAWPPLWLPLAWLSYAASEAWLVPVHLAAKSIPIAVDVVIVFLLHRAAHDYRLPPMRTALLYALNPVAIYICALHGNFDQIPTMCALQAVLLADRQEHDLAHRHAAAWLGVGAAFKTWPLFILPALIAHVSGLRRRAEAAAIAIAIFAAALLLPVPFVGWRAAIDPLLYRSEPDWWGITSLSFLFQVPIPASAIFYAAMPAASLLLLAARPPAAAGALLLLLTFLATTPGFGVQYLVWLLPIALLADQRRGLAFSLVAGGALAWEVAMRPYTGHPGDLVRLLPHAGFAHAFRHGADHVNTVIERLVVWAFVCIWSGATLVSIVRSRRAHRDAAEREN
jgi:hypothetical protein